MRRIFLCLLIVLSSFAGSVQAAAISVEAGAAVDPAYIAETKRVAAITENYFLERQNLVIQQPVQIILVNGKDEYIDANMKYTNASRLEAERRSRTTVAWVSNQVIISNIAAQSLPRQRVFAIAHELAHQFQGEMAGRSTFASLWLTEGTADFWAGQVVERAGFYTVSQYRKGWEQGMTHFADRPDLGTLIKRTDWYSALEQYGTPLTYRTADLGIFALLDRTNEQALFVYFRRLGETGDYEQAFRDAFGQDASSFYEEFQLPPYLRQAS